MKRKSGYLLQRIKNTSYILPYGQPIAEQRRGVSLNDTGVYIWNLLEREMSREELHREYLKQFPAGPGQKDEMIKDLDQFLNHLIKSGFIEDDGASEPYAEWPCTHLNIGGLVIGLYVPKELIEASFLKDFCTPPGAHADQRVFLTWDASDSASIGNILVRDCELIVCERDKDYVLAFPSFSRIREVNLSKDGETAVFRCIYPCTDELVTEFFHALRHVFLYLAKKRGIYAIHSASICYQGMAWLFSASSGTGKSTHTNLWKELYNAELLNGDLNLLTLEDGRPVVHGLPWCGTSEIFSKRTMPLGGIILLKQAPSDILEELSPVQKTLLVMQRFISPMWAAQQLKSSVQFAEDLSEKILICRLQCTKNNSAAELAKSRIDAYISQICHK